MAIHSVDSVLLEAFLEREAYDFFAIFDARGGKQEYLERMYKEINDISDKNPCDFICVQSLTNQGMLQRELVLTPTNWKPEAGRLELFLPSSPRPSFDIGHHLKGR